VGQLNLRSYYNKGLTMMGYRGLSATEEQRRAALEHVLAELTTGRLHVHIDAVLSLDQAAEAHRRIVDKDVRGKILLSVGNWEPTIQTVG